MAKQIFGFGSSVPTSASESLNRTIPMTPQSIKLAAFGLFVPNQSNNVLLNATVGVKATALTPTALFTIFRNSAVIFTTRITLDEDVGDFQTISFQAIETNAPGGYHSYSVRVELDSSLLLDQAEVIGPITFSGYSIG
ncbi:hypothetical protein [Pseudalkalibacillus hwajinpoensis]|uniref:Exosporium protein C n=1 Tax=Guptibacillus hwajinpoensis TaxID=208199 RepID=A0A4U1MLS7_9BACL|nr:hypothetical protein [Pseudalkalibacillus hwajinpoensis]TKD71867.1 hypothetical protein FBF83_03440 [Pseudalkalibacillus hwajinpoensis]